MLDKHVIIGRLGRPHALKGWLRLNSETDPPANILDYQPWLIKVQNELESQPFKPLKVTGSMMQGDILLVHIEGIDNPEDAKILSGTDVYIERDQLPALSNDEYYWADLEGLAIFTTMGIPLGVVDYLIKAGACDVMVVKGDKEVLIPFDLQPNEQGVVRKVDLKLGKIIVEWDINIE